MKRYTQSAKTAFVFSLSLGAWLFSASWIPPAEDSSSCSCGPSRGLELKQFSFDFEGGEDAVIVRDPVYDENKSCCDGPVGHRDVAARYTRQELPLLLHDSGDNEGPRGYYARFTAEIQALFQQSRAQFLPSSN